MIKVVPCNVIESKCALSHFRFSLLEFLLQFGDTVVIYCLNSGRCQQDRMTYSTLKTRGGCRGYKPMMRLRGAIEFVWVNSKAATGLFHLAIVNSG